MRSAPVAYRPASLDGSGAAPDGSPVSLHELVGVEEPEYERAEVADGLRRALDGLKTRDQTVLLLRLVGGLSQQEIARRIEVSQMHVSRILRSTRGVVLTACGSSPA